MCEVHDLGVDSVLPHAAIVRSKLLYDMSKQLTVQLLEFAAHLPICPLQDNVLSLLTSTSSEQSIRQASATFLHRLVHRLKQTLAMYQDPAFQSESTSQGRVADMTTEAISKQNSYPHVAQVSDGRALTLAVRRQQCFGLIQRHNV